MLNIVYNYNKELVNQWIKEGKNTELSLFFRFFCFWIAFNHFITAKYQVSGDMELLRRFNKEYNNHFKKLVNSNEELREKIRKLRQQTPIYDTRPENRNVKIIIDDGTDIKQVFDTIYQIRCNLIHGSKIFDADRDNILVQLAYEILFVIIEEFLEVRQNE